MSRVLDRRPALAGEVLRGETRFTQRWVHGELHNQLAPMIGHVVMSYYGAAREVGWREGSEELSTRAPGRVDDADRAGA
jgi:hypothetical protein